VEPVQSGSFRLRPMAAWLVASVLLVACGAALDPTASPSVVPATIEPASPGPSATPAMGSVEPAPGSESAVYAPNPGAIVVAIDPGHGGCLDWGVADPSQRGAELSEKAMTLAIGRLLRDRLEADGIGVVMVRDGDEALAGDHHPELGCEGPPWRDVNGDGEAGFDPEGAIRTRDELQARLDLANLSQADAFVSIHINSPFDGGQTIEIAFSETFYTDETPWGELSAVLAAAVQDGVVRELGSVATYGRGDRGVTAHNFYLVAPPLFEPTAERPDPRKQPTRGALMPTVLAEVGSITLRAEHDLLASAAGQEAVAAGLFDGLVQFFAQRDHAARIGVEGELVARTPAAVEGDGPPFWAPVIADDRFRVRVTNTGHTAIPAGARLVAGWSVTADPYLAAAPLDLAPVSRPLPELKPGASVTIDLQLEPPSGERALAWISLESDSVRFDQLGSPALQVATPAP
jgi:N-acetylmuramoyl-L-alanine amidase